MKEIKVSFVQREKKKRKTWATENLARVVQIPFH